MGIMQRYFPEKMAVKLAEFVNADTFIETGTYSGKTTKWAATKFKEVHTIELSETLFAQYGKGLSSIGNITPYFGDSRNILPEILTAIHGNILFWLDAHYSAGVTAGKEDPCPLLAELEMILRRNNDDIILIDDARCVDGTGGWPTISELLYYTVQKAGSKKRFMLICDDNIYIVPDEDKLKAALYEYSLQRDTEMWNQIRNEKNKPKRLARSVLKFLGIYNIAIKFYRNLK